MGKVRLRRIEIMDTTLRDGEQSEGISMMPEEKRTIARRLLEAVKVDWVAPNGTPGIVAAKFLTPNGLVRI